MVLLQLVFMVTILLRGVASLGSMSSMAASYGENGQTLCSLRGEDANLVTCFGSDVASVYGAPQRLPLIGITGTYETPVTPLTHSANFEPGF